MWGYLCYLLDLRYLQSWGSVFFSLPCKTNCLHWNLFVCSPFCCCCLRIIFFLLLLWLYRGFLVFVSVFRTNQQYWWLANHYNIGNFGLFFLWKLWIPVPKKQIWILLTIRENFWYFGKSNWLIQKKKETQREEKHWLIFLELWWWKGLCLFCLFWRLLTFQKGNAFFCSSVKWFEFKINLTWFRWNFQLSTLTVSWISKLQLD